MAPRPPQGPRDPFGPMDRMGRWDDPELAEIFRDEPELYELGRTLRAARPDPAVGPHFEAYLRAKLMDAAPRELRRRGISRWLRPRPGVFAGGGAVLGLAMIAAVVVATVVYHPDDSRTFRVTANVAENHSVSPDDVIRVSFNQPVDHLAVEHNLEIHPATSVQTRWDGTTLVITPLHHLAANTPYTVTIPRTAVRDQSGRAATADIHIAFGTAPTPGTGLPTPPAQPPVLQPQDLGPVSGDSQVLLAPDGSVVATGGLVSAAAASPSATASAGASAIPLPGLHGRPTPSLLGGSPSASAAASPAGSPTPAPPTPELLAFTASGGVVLGPEATVAAYSPSGRSLAYLVAHGTQASLVVARPDGTHPVTLVRGADAGSPLAWSGEDSLVFVSGGSLSMVDLQGRVRTVSGGVHIAPHQDVALAPGGQVAYVGPVPSGGASPSPSPSASDSASAGATPSPDSVGHLVNLATGTDQPLQGIRRLPAFSANGARVAWVDESGDTPVLEVMAVGDPAAAPVSLSTAATAGDTLGGLALSGDGSRLAYTLSHAGGTPALRVVAVSSGDTVAVGPGQVVAASLSQGGDRVAFLRPTSDGMVAAVALIPGSAPATPAPDAVPADAAALLDRFVAAQIGGDLATLRTLATADLTLDGTLTPSGVTRSYVIKAAYDPTAGTVEAHVRLVRDASHSAATSFADETVRMVRGADGQGFQVAAAAVSDFQSEPNGPQVVHVSTAREQSVLVVRIAFDSDLDPATVNGTVFSLTGAHVGGIAPEVGYEVESRTVVIRVGDVAGATLDLAVSDALRDIAGQSLVGGYATTLQG